MSVSTSAHDIAPIRARHLAERSFKQAATVGGGPAGRFSAAPHGAKVQAGGDGEGRDRVGRPSRARHSTERSFKRAATEGGGPAGRSGAAPHGAEVQANGDGSGGGGASISPGRGISRGRGFKQAAKAAVGTGWSVGRGRAGRDSRGRDRRARVAPDSEAGHPETTTPTLTWVNTHGDGGVGRPAHRESTPVIPGRASRPGSAPGRPEWPWSGRCSGVGAARKTGMRGPEPREGRHEDGMPLLSP